MPFFSIFMVIILILDPLTSSLAGLSEQLFVSFLAIIFTAFTLYCIPSKPLQKQYCIFTAFDMCDFIFHCFEFYFSYILHFQTHPPFPNTRYLNFVCLLFSTLLMFLPLSFLIILLSISLIWNVLSFPYQTTVLSCLSCHHIQLLLWSLPSITPLHVCTSDA